MTKNKLKTPTFEEFKEKCDISLYGFMAEDDEIIYQNFSYPNSTEKDLYDKLKELEVLEIVFVGAQIKLPLYKNLAYFINYKSEQEMREDL